MSGRFFTAPLFAATVILTGKRNAFTHRSMYQYAVLVFVLVLSLTGQKHVLTGASSAGDEMIDAHGISDERGYYYCGTGLLRDRQNPDAQKGDFAVAALLGDKVRRKGLKTLETLYIGYYGYSQGPASISLTSMRLPTPCFPDCPPSRKERGG